MTGIELAIVLAAVVVGSTVKAITGMGLPLIAIPIATLFVDLDDAVVVIALPNLLANAVLAAREREHVRTTRDLPVLAATGVVGAIAGTVLFVNVSEKPLVIALVAAVVAYIVTFFTKPNLRTTAAQSRRLAPGAGLIAGLFQGAIGISGPIVGSWIHSYRLPRGAHILSVTALFLAAGIGQFTVLIVNGELEGRMIATILACGPVLAAIPIGTRLRGRINSRGFDLTIIAMLGLSALVLCIRTFVSVL